MSEAVQGCPLGRWAGPDETAPKERRPRGQAGRASGNWRRSCPPVMGGQGTALRSRSDGAQMAVRTKVAFSASSSRAMASAMWALASRESAGAALAGTQQPAGCGRFHAAGCGRRPGAGRRTGQRGHQGLELLALQVAAQQVDVLALPSSLQTAFCSAS